MDRSGWVLALVCYALVRFCLRWFALSCVVVYNHQSPIVIIIISCVCCFQLVCCVLILCCLLVY